MTSNRMLLWEAGSAGRMHHQPSFRPAKPASHSRVGVES